MKELRWKVYGTTALLSALAAAGLGWGAGLCIIILGAYVGTIFIEHKEHVECVKKVLTIDVTKDAFYGFLMTKTGACEEGMAWVQAIPARTLKGVWGAIPRGDWAMWLADEIGVDLKLRTKCGLQAVLASLHLVTDVEAREAIRRYCTCGAAWLEDPSSFRECEYVAVNSLVRKLRSEAANLDQSSRSILTEVPWLEIDPRAIEKKDRDVWTVLNAIQEAQSYFGKVDHYVFDTVEEEEDEAAPKSYEMACIVRRFIPPDMIENIVRRRMLDYPRRAAA